MPPLLMECKACGANKAEDLLVRKEVDKVDVICLSCHRQDWRPMIEETARINRPDEQLEQKPVKYLSQMLAQVPPEDVQQSVQQLDNVAIYKLLKMAKAKALEKKKGEEEKLQLYRIERAHAEYAKHFVNLLELAYQSDKRTHEAQSQQVGGLCLVPHSYKYHVSFVLPEYSKKGMKVTKGDKLKVQYRPNGQSTHPEYEGEVVQFRAATETTPDRVTIEMEKRPLEGTSQDWHCEVIMNEQPYERMGKALRDFRQGTAASTIITSKILGLSVNEQRSKMGRTLPSDLNVRGLPPLNPSQTEAVKTVLKTVLCESPGQGLENTLAEDLSVKVKHVIFHMFPGRFSVTVNCEILVIDQAIAG
ncbi:unnamed protein product, partial [Mesorhabditis spiculigera]